MKKFTSTSIGIFCSILNIIISITGLIWDGIATHEWNYFWTVSLICGVCTLLSCVEERKKNKK